MKTNDVVKFKNRSGSFELREKALRQSLVDAGYDWREASRYSLYRYFTKVQKTGKFGNAWGKYAGHVRFVSMWGISVTDGRLRIGCCFFPPVQTRLIRKWALAWQK